MPIDIEIGRFNKKELTIQDIINFNMQPNYKLGEFPYNSNSKGKSYRAIFLCPFQEWIKILPSPIYDKDIFITNQQNQTITVHCYYINHGYVRNKMKLKNQQADQIIREHVLTDHHHVHVIPIKQTNQENRTTITHSTIQPQVIYNKFLILKQLNIIINHAAVQKVNSPRKHHRRHY